MIKDQKVSLAALRILAYTILVKAISGVVIIIGTALSSDALYSVAMTAEIINTVACVLCLIGVTALSKQFIYAFRTTIAVLLLESFAMLSAVFELFLTATGHTAMASATDYFALASSSAGRLLIGAALLFLMKAFGEMQQNDGNSSAASSAVKTSIVYCCLVAASVVLSGLKVVSNLSALEAVSMIINLSAIALEVLMYRMASKAAYSYWRKSTAGALGM